MRILLTNDDGWESPFMPFFVAYLSAISDLTIALPLAEQSWTGKGMTRFGPLTVEERELSGVQAFVISGRPADCLNLALHNLCEEPPDLVVSGINIGSNTGIGFILSSGTVGACLEANIGGVPGLAISQCMVKEEYRAWVTNNHLAPKIVDRLCNNQKKFLDAAFAELDLSGKLLQGSRGACPEPAETADRAVTWNVNLPHTPHEAWRVIHTDVGHTTYSNCFIADGDNRYHHDLGDNVQPDLRPESDGVVSFHEGHVSLGCIDIWKIGQRD
jgi:broad specificity polyphosphatase/5'/3'-nucleotidase SurE